MSAAAEPSLIEFAGLRQGGSSAEAGSSSATPQEGRPPIVLERLQRVEQLVDLGLEPLKCELSRRGLKCGGTLEQRAARLWATKGKPRAEWDKSILAK